MTNNNHPITPPPELVQQWMEATRSNDCIGAYPPDYEHLVATQAARWGADQELEACCSWVEGYAECGGSLRAARRPKPPSIKEQALEALEKWAEDEYGPGAVFHKGLEVGLIRRALQSLPD